MLAWIALALVLAAVAATTAALIANRALTTAPPGLGARLAASLGSNAAEVAPDSRYPELRPPVYAATPREVTLAAAEVLRQLGFEAVELDGERHVLSAVAVTPLLRFRDDISLAVQPHERGSVLTGRSASRVGRGDLGANRNHLLRVLDALSTRLVVVTDED